MSSGDGNVVYPHIVTRLNLAPERVLTRALQANLEGVVVLGFDADGHEYMASSIADGGSVIWLIERCKLKLLQMPESDDGV